MLTFIFNKLPSRQENLVKMMRLHPIRLAAATTLAVFAISACSSSPSVDAGPTTEAEAAVVKGYSEIAHENYEDSLDGAKKLKAAVDAFVAAPSKGTLDAAKEAWKAARPSYVQTEVFRFYGGPIDAEDTGPEGAINAWPLDENYIDYVDGNESAGIINDTAKFPSITKDVLLAENEKGGEKNIATGWHAIEFLLWGQDKSATGPGERPFTDYVETGGTAKNQARRGQYLKACAELLVEQLEGVEEEWEPGAPSKFVTTFQAEDPKVALGDILKGMGSLAATELPRERMNNAYAAKDQEEEHSCFSDTTVPIDLVNDVIGIENVYLGRYGTKQATGLTALVAAKNPELDKKMKDALAKARASVLAIPGPFDQAILGADDAPGRKAVKIAMDDVKVIGTLVVEIAGALGVTINLEEN